MELLLRHDIKFEFIKKIIIFFKQLFFKSFRQNFFYAIKKERAICAILKLSCTFFISQLLIFGCFSFNDSSRHNIILFFLTFNK